MHDLNADNPLQPYRDEDAPNLRELLAPAGRHWGALLAAAVVAGGLGAAGSYLVKPQFTSTTTFLPPQQQQSAAASALASLGAFAGLAGAVGVKSPTDQYVAIMESVTVSDRMIDRFHLMKVYEKKYRKDARKALANHVLFVVGKKDGLISVSVDDGEPGRAADMANAYVEELRRMTSVLAVSEAQQRRVFFEKEMQDTKARLIAAQTRLQASGFTSGAIKAAPQAAAEQYAQLRAQATAAEVKLQTLRASMAETAPEVRQQVTQLAALRSKLAEFEASTQSEQSTPDYVSNYREFKYQEAMFDLFSKQYELARVDESREGALIQVLDPAQPAETKSKPVRSLIALVCAFIGGLAMAIGLVLRDRQRRAA